MCKNVLELSCLLSLPELKPGPLDQEASTLTMKPTHLHKEKKQWKANKNNAMKPMVIFVMTKANFLTTSLFIGIPQICDTGRYQNQAMNSMIFSISKLRQKNAFAKYKIWYYRYCDFTSLDHLKAACAPELCPIITVLLSQLSCCSMNGIHIASRASTVKICVNCCHYWGQDFTNNNSKNTSRDTYAFIGKRVI